MRLGVLGHSGRLGGCVITAAAHAGIALSGGCSGRAGPPAGLRLFATAADLAAESDVVIDFTVPDAAPAHAAAVQAAGCAWVLGTTGLTDAQSAHVIDAARTVAVVWAANFSAGITLLLDAATRLAARLPAADYDAEILEMHHRGKRDAPSGTALAFGHAVAAGRGVTLAAHRADQRDGPRPPGAIGFASLRGGGVAGEHTLFFAGPGERLALSHTAEDRGVFARGALRAAAWTLGRPPGLYDMRDVLGLPGQNPGPAAPSTSSGEP